MFAQKNVPLARIQVYKRGHLSLLIGIGRPFICRQRDKKGITEVLDLNCAHQALILTPCLIKNLFERREWPRKHRKTVPRQFVVPRREKYGAPKKPFGVAQLIFPLYAWRNFLRFPLARFFRADSRFFFGGGWREEREEPKTGGGARRWGLINVQPTRRLF